MINRMEAKANAKSIIRGRNILDGLLLCLILLGIQILPRWLIWKFSFFNTLPMYLSNGDLEWWIWELADATPAILALPSFIGVIQTLAGLLFGAGLVRCALRLHRGDQTVRVEETLTAFDKLWKFICIFFLQKLLLLLWNLPAVAVIIMAVVALGKGHWVICIVLLLASVVWSVIITINKSLQYFFSYYICEDNPKLGAVACIQRSGELTEGRKWELLVARLSFIGWDLLDAIFIPQIFTIPYRYLTYAGIYRQLSGAKEELQPAVRPAEAAAARIPAIEFISGEYAGTQVPAEDGTEIRIGRDPKQAQVVVSQDNGMVSGLHCGIRYDSFSDRYFVTDYSSNGTYADGIRLPAGSTPVRRGTVLKLADGAVLLRLV